MQIRRLRVKMPERVSLFEDADRIEKLLMGKLGVTSHEELHKKLEEITPALLKEILDELLNEINAEKEKDEAPPDRLKGLREKAKEMWVVAR